MAISSQGRELARGMGAVGAFSAVRIGQGGGETIAQASGAKFRVRCKECASGMYMEKPCTVLVENEQGKKIHWASEKPAAISTSQSKSEREGRGGGGLLFRGRRLSFDDDPAEKLVEEHVHAFEQARREAKAKARRKAEEKAGNVAEGSPGKAATENARREGNTQAQSLFLRRFKKVAPVSLQHNKFNTQIRGACTAL